MTISVKPLLWPDRGPTPSRRLVSQGGLVRYTIAFCGKNENDHIVYRWASEGNTWSFPFYSLDDAKAAAQADYERCVLSALSVEHKEWE